MRPFSPSCLNTDQRTPRRSNANSVTAALWTAYEVCKRPDLLCRVRAVAEAAYDSRFRESESVKLGNDPLLQSIFAEVTRLRVVGIVPRYTVGGDFELGQWTIPEGSVLGLPSRAGALNENVWNAGTRDHPHPLDQFWADRFLVYPGDPGSGPLRRDQKSNLSIGSKVDGSAAEEPVFSLKGLKNVYTPFAGGSSICPGRHFAKHEVVSTLARLVLQYDIEIQKPPTWEPRMDPAFFPAGTLPPLDKIPFRIRRRTVKHGL